MTSLGCRLMTDARAELPVSHLRPHPLFPINRLLAQVHSQTLRVYQDESTPLWVRPRIGCFTGPLGLYARLGHGARWLSQWNEEICELLKALPNFL